MNRILKAQIFDKLWKVAFLNSGVRHNNYTINRIKLRMLKGQQNMEIARSSTVT